MSASQPMSEAMYYILLALNKPCHGYALMMRIAELSGERIQMGPGTLYGILTRMERDGLIEIESVDTRRKTYMITALGLATLKEEYIRLKKMVDDGLFLEEGI